MMGMVAQAFSPSTWDAKAVGPLLSLGPALSTLKVLWLDWCPRPTPGSLAWLQRMDSFCNYTSEVQLDISNGDASRCSFIVHNCFSYPEFFVFKYAIEYCLFKVVKELCWNFYGDCIEFVDCFW